MTREETPPPVDSSDLERRKIFLRYSNRAWLIFGIVTSAALPFFPSQQTTFIFLAVIAFSTYLIVRFVNMSGRTTLAGMIFSLAVNFGFYGLFMVYASLIGANKAFETESTVWLLMGLAVLFAGALVDRRAALIFAALNTILLIVTQLMIAPNSEPRPSAVVFWWMMALTVWIYEGTLRDTLKRAWSEVLKQQQAYKAAQEAETKYRKLVERLPVVVYTSELGINGKWQYVSPQIESMLGFTPDEWMSDPTLWYRQVHLEDRDHQEELEEQAWAWQGTFESEYRIRARDGHYIWVRDSAQILRPQDDNGVPIVQGVLIDITESRMAEEALRENENLLREAQIAADMGNYMLDFATGTWKSSSILDKIFGIDDTFIRSMEGWGELIHPDHRQEMMDYLTDEVIGKHVRFDREYKIVRKNDGDERWVHGLGELVTDAHGRLSKMYGVIQDVTTRKQAEDETRQRVMELGMLYESGLAINRLLNPQEIGQKITELLEHKLGWQITRVRLYHSEDDTLELLAFNQPGLKDDEEGQRKVEECLKSMLTGSDQGLNGWAIKQKQVIRSNDLDHDPHYVETYPGLRSGLYVPMMLGERVIGVISIESEQPNAFSATDERLSVTLANQAASALENARLFEAERAQRQVSEALRDALSVGAALSASLDFETIFDRLLESLERVVPFEGGSIMLVDSEKQKIHIAKIRGYHRLEKAAIENLSTLSFDIASVENLRWVIENKQPLVLSDVSQYPAWVKVPETGFIRSWTGAPITVNAEVIALFSLDSGMPNFFTNEHVELMRAFTGQASLALQNARLFEQTKRGFKEFAALYEISKALSANNDLEALLKEIVEHATSLLNANTGAMYLYDQASESLKIVVSTTPFILIGTTLRLGEGVAGRVAQTRQPMRLEHYSSWEGRSSKYEGLIFNAILEVPILFGGSLIGVLNVAEMGDSSRIFTESDERLLSLFAAQAAGALHSARLFEQTERRAREFASLYETSSALAAENELKPMLQAIVEHAKNLLGSASSGMYLYMPETGEMELTVDTTPYTTLGTRLKLNEGIAGRVAKTRQPIRVDNYSNWEGRSPAYDGTPLRAVLEVPMLYGGELIGVLAADEVGDSERKFTEADEHLLSLFASQAAGAIHSARLREQTTRRLNQLQALHLIDRAISSSFDLRPILNTVISHTISQLKVDAVDVLLYHPHLQTLEYIAGQGFHTRAIEHTVAHFGEGNAGHAAFERRTIYISDLQNPETNFMRASLLAGEGFVEYYGVPLIAKGEIKGVMEIFDRTTSTRDPDWLNFLETLAGQAAITIDQTQLFENLQRANYELITAYDATIEGWARAMDLRDKETENHTRRVTDLTLSLARRLGISDAEMLHIRRGALLHDIGKMGVPDKILLKGGKLTAKEWNIMRQHPQFAYEMLQPITYLKRSLEIPYCHHEKWDGTGYPRGLKGEQIPLVARIFAVVDVWDAITSERPYRIGWSKSKALKYIREQSGKHFDPKVVDAFLEMIEAEKS
jgi:PAS domain S-box-containing protein/putative nucleotidyltransferase with HDIG domain